MIDPALTCAKSHRNQVNQIIITEDGGRFSRKLKDRELLLNLKDKWKKYLVISAFDHDGEPEPNGQAVMRKLDELMFGNPIVKELLEPEGCNLYIWKK